MTIAEPVSITTASLPTLPFVQAGLITFEVVPLAPYPGVARLFAAYGEPGGSPSIS